MDIKDLLSINIKKEWCPSLEHHSIDQISSHKGSANRRQNKEILSFFVEMQPTVMVLEGHKGSANK